MFPVERLPIAQAYADLLAVDGVVRGLIGPREAPRLWPRHLVNSALIAEVVPPGARVADIGSGAGLPGIPLAIARPDVHVTLVEPLLRRATFLTEAVDALALTNVVVLRSRGEDMHGSAEVAPGFDVVTSRAVASTSQLVEWCMPLVAPHGCMVALKGESASDEIAAAARVLAMWGCATPEVLEVGVGRVSEPTHVVRVAWKDPSSVSWPPRRKSTHSRSSNSRSSNRRRR